MKKLLGTWMVICGLGLSGVAEAGTPTDVLKGSVVRLVGGARSREAAELLDRTLAYDMIGAAVLPDRHGNLTEEQHAEFMNVFSELLRRTYMKNLGSLKGAKVEWIDEIHVPKDDTVYVKVRAVKGRETVELEFRMSCVIDQWQVSDVVVEGSSMVRTWRSQVLKIMNRDGFDGMMKKLRGKLAKG